MEGTINTKLGKPKFTKLKMGLDSGSSVTKIIKYLQQN